MLNPCYDHCYLKYGKQYTKECDTICDYAIQTKVIGYLLDMLEEEHMGMRSIAIREVNNKFGKHTL